MSTGVEYSQYLSWILTLLQLFLGEIPFLYLFCQPSSPSLVFFDPGSIREFGGYESVSLPTTFLLFSFLLDLAANHNYLKWTVTVQKILYGAGGRNPSAGG